MGPPGPKLELSAKKIGKWLCPSTLKGQLSCCVSGGTSMVPRYGFQSWLLRKVCPTPVIGNSVLGMIGPDLKSGEEPTVPGFGTVIYTAHTPFGGEKSGTRKTKESVKLMISTPASISWL